MQTGPAICFPFPDSRFPAAEPLRVSPYPQSHRHLPDLVLSVLVEALPANHNFAPHLSQ